MISQALCLDQDPHFCLCSILKQHPQTTNNIMVSWNNGTPKSSIYRWIFHDKPTILGDPIHGNWKPPYITSIRIIIPPPCRPSIFADLRWNLRSWIRPQRCARLPRRQSGWICRIIPSSSLAQVVFILGWEKSMNIMWSYVAPNLAIESSYVHHQVAKWV